MTNDERQAVQHLCAKVAWCASLVDDFDGYDPYGSAMAHAFAAAGVLYTRDDDDSWIPDEWAYRPGLSPMADIGPESWHDNSSDYIRLVGSVAVEVAEACRALGLDY